MSDSTRKRDATRACRYLRVSTTDQRQDLQDDETIELIERRGWQLAGTYSDQGVSGSREHRRGLDDMLADARRGRFDVVVVWRSDRLFRSLKNMVNTLAELDALNVAFVSCTEAFDTTTPQGKLLMHLVAAFAEFERTTIAERVRAGLAAARRRGVRLGRPGVDLDVAKAAQMRASGLSYREIARQLGVGAGRIHGALNANSGVQKRARAASAK
ncbi:MAG: recombinase family protein [Deltaproteobacteria bacterium]|nr:recombinase family protein [Deltaproteobacteria bacterium]